MTDEEKAKNMITNDLVLKLDQAAIGYSCEYSYYFRTSLESIYKIFRLKCELDVKPRKQRNI